MIGRRGRAGAKFAALLIAAAAGLSLAGCSIPIADIPLIGLPTNAPVRSDNPPQFLPVNDVPADRRADTLNPTDQSSQVQQLRDAANRQKAAAAAADAADSAAATGSVSAR